MVINLGTTASTLMPISEFSTLMRINLTYHESVKSISNGMDIAPVVKVVMVILKCK
jgi:hypothetical protein